MPVEKAYMARSLADEYARHNQEIRKIRKFIRQKGASARFEKEFLGSVQWFLEKGEKALEMLVKSDYEKLRDKAGEEGLLCHGEYNQHNVLLCKNQAAVTNFGHFSFDVQISDLYCFMRKILEKYNWDVFLARRMLEQYDKIRPISDVYKRQSYCCWQLLELYLCLSRWSPGCRDIRIRQCQHLKAWLRCHY